MLFEKYFFYNKDKEKEGVTEMIVARNYENLNILHENTMPNRCYYIPSSKGMSNYVHDREKSDRFQLLNDQWKFKYYPVVGPMVYLSFI